MKGIMQETLLMWVVDLRPPDPQLTNLLMKASTELYHLFSTQKNAFWKGHLCASVSRNECCIVEGADGSLIARACWHNWYKTTVAHVRAKERGEHSRKYVCGVDGCKFGCVTIEQLHRHQCCECIVLRREGLIIQGYHECGEVDKTTGESCTYGIASGYGISFERILEAQRQHYEENHVKYQCEHTWCTHTLIGRIRSLARAPLSAATRLYFEHLLVCIREHLDREVVPGEVAELVKRAKVNLSDSSSFNSKTALLQHTAEVHTTTAHFSEIDVGCTVSKLLSDYDEHRKCFIAGEMLGTFTLGTVAEIANRLANALIPIAMTTKNTQALLFGCMAPADLYSDDHTSYMQKLVSIHVSASAVQHACYWDKIISTIVDLYKLEHVCTGIINPDYCVLLMAYGQSLLFELEEGEWWTAAAHQDLCVEMFGLCCHVHSTLRNSLAHVNGSDALPATVSYRLISDVHTALMAADCKVCENLVGPLTRCAVHTGGTMAHNWVRVFENMSAALDTIRATKSIRIDRLCALVAAATSFVYASQHHIADFVYFCQCVDSLRHRLKGKQMQRALATLLHLPGALRVSHLCNPIHRGLPVAATVAAHATADCLHCEIDIIAPGVVPVAPVRATQPAEMLRQLLNSVESALSIRHPTPGTAAQDRCRVKITRGGEPKLYVSHIQ